MLLQAVNFTGYRLIRRTLLLGTNKVVVVVVVDALLKVELWQYVRVKLY